MLKKLLFCLAIISISQAVFAKNLPKIAQIPGGIVQLELPIKSKKKPVVFYGNHRVFVSKTESKFRWKVVIGLPLLAYPGQHHISIVQPKERIPFFVKRKYYANKRIDSKKLKNAKPTKNDRVTIAADMKDIAKTLAHWSEIIPFESPFKLPSKGKVSNSFGRRLIINGVSAGPNKAMDIYAKAGTPVHPAAPGIVIKIGNYFYLGKTIFVDHGQGVISLYSHLEKVKVSKGRHVSRKSTLGLIGETGRTDKPHLSWMMVMNQNAVNPSLFLS